MVGWSIALRSSLLAALTRYASAQAAVSQQDPGKDQMTAADAVTETISGAAGTMNP
jgi:hypothetical protein